MDCPQHNRSKCKDCSKRESYYLNDDGNCYGKCICQNGNADHSHASCRSGHIRCIEGECNTGYHLKQLSASRRECVLNICNCDNGIPVQGQDCLNPDGDDHCDSCNDFYHLDGKICAKNVCKCPNAQWA